MRRPVLGRPSLGMAFRTVVRPDVDLDAELNAPYHAQVVLRPVSTAIWVQVAGGAPLGILGLLAAWGAGSNGKPIGVVIGIPAVLIAGLMVLNKTLRRVKLSDGILSSSGLLDRRSVATSAITAIVPVEITIYPTRLVKRWHYKSRYLDVRTASGTTGIWLNCRVYGTDKVEALLHELHHEPRSKTEYRTVRY